ncbi:hydroxylamine reductase [Anaeramoeba ignava]|uniref:Hydroxylamine reductase n=1 Tax=Anaeramoeba ignava TaxID=1746090 RepID=A0A9Q0RF40_ANAIG|nr:hydroxylamine reductase [Anaeramoeba ignava]
MSLLSIIKSKSLTTTKLHLQNAISLNLKRQFATKDNSKMFCYQCEQTQDGTGCNGLKGVCGKTSFVASLQDLLLNVTKKISTFTSMSRQLGTKNPEVDRFVLESLFSTVTNVNFDEVRFKEYLQKAESQLEKAEKDYREVCQSKGIQPKMPTFAKSFWKANPDLGSLIEEGKKFSILKRNRSKDLTGIEEMILYGIKGGAAYLEHAKVLGIEDEEAYSFMHDCLKKLTEELSLDELLKLAMDTGKWNFKVMELLDKANTQGYGDPVPTKVSISPVAGKCIVVSGHDLYDLELVLKQTENKNINVYTHGEMLPAHGYPKLKKYKHLVGNYGGAWQNQKKEFSAFPGSILMTTNCIVPPSDAYRHRVFTRSVVGFPGVQHILSDDLSPLINSALLNKGFLKDSPRKEILVGFGHKTVLGIADLIIDAVKSGAIKHFFLIGGCDGYELDRNYFTDFAKRVPKDCVILTLACGKYRFNKLDFGTIKHKGVEIPRLLDIGQCNDSYSAIKIAVALAEAFKTDVNGLPLSLILSWFEQKAVAVLLTLLSLGVKNIRIGPRLPAFLTPPVVKVLVDNFGIKPISSSPKKDLKELLKK